jgi:hypothetical protein
VQRNIPTLPDDKASSKRTFRPGESSRGKKRKSGTGNNEDTGDDGGDDGDHDFDLSWQPKLKGRSGDKNVVRQ